MTEITPKWQRYLELLKQENASYQEEEAIKYIQGDSGGWRTYKDAAENISQFLINKTKNHEDLSLANVSPAYIHAIITIAIDTDDMGTWDSDKWRRTLVYAKDRLLKNARTSYPAPGAENDGGGNVFGSFLLKYNSRRGKNGQHLD